MIDLSNYPEIQSAQNRKTKIMLDLVAVSNLQIDHNNDLDTDILSVSNINDTVSVLGDYSHIQDRYAVIGHEIVYINSATLVSSSGYGQSPYGYSPYGGGSSSGQATIFSISREIRGTKKDSINLAGYKIRTVELFATNTKNFEIDESKGNQGEPFSYQKENGNVELIDDIKKWTYGSPEFQYRFKRKKSAVYLFLGFENDDRERVLKNIMFGDRFYTISPSTNNIQQVTIEFDSKWMIWEKESIKENLVFKNIYPKELFASLLNYNKNMIYYANGNIESDFTTTNNLFAKEYSTYGDLFSALIKNGLYCYWDELERLKISTTLTVDNLTSSVDLLNKDIIKIDSRSDNNLVLNVVKGTYLERKALFDFESLNNKYIDFKYTINSISHTYMSVVNGIYTTNILEVSDSNLYTSTKTGSIVILKDTANGFEFYGKTLGHISPNKVQIAFNYDQDSSLFYLGKADYLQFLGYTSSRDFDLYYSGNELPNIGDFKRNLDGKDVNSYLRQAILPQITEESEDEVFNFSIELGNPTNIQVGEPSGNFEQIDSIYGTFTGADLLYNRPLDQFNNTTKPPIAMITTQITSDGGRGENALIRYGTFDNSDIEVEIVESEDDSSDIKVKLKNTKNITSSNLLTVTPITFEDWGNLILEIDLSTYNNTSVGDVLKIKEQTIFTDAVERDIYENKKKLTWIVQEVYESSGQYFIQVDNDIPNLFDLIKYPFDSIVFLQKFYLKGNPLIQFNHPVTLKNQSSIEQYDEREVVIDSRPLDNISFRRVADFYKNNFGGVESDFSDLRRIRNIDFINKLELQKYDLVTITDTKYTDLDGSNLWIFLGGSYGSANNGNLVRGQFMNINTQNANPENIELPTILQYKPIENPTYNHQGNEGMPSEVKEDLSNPNTSVGSDEMFGRTAYSEIPTTDINAKVKSFDGTDIILDNINIGNTNYDTKLSTVGNTVIFKIDEELIIGYVKDWDGGSSESTITIIKREFCNSRKTKIVSGQGVIFQTLVSGTVEGELISRSINVGDQVYYLRFTVDDGLNVNAKEVFITADGQILVKNDNNKLFFDNSTNKSQFLQNVVDVDDVHFDDYDFHIGDKDASHIARKNDGTFELDVQELRIQQTQSPSSLGAELLVNGSSVYIGDFNSPSDWTLGTDWSITAGEAVKVAGTSTSIYPTLPVSIGVSEFYQIEIDVATTTNGDITISLGGDSYIISGDTAASPRTFTFVLESVNTNNLDVLSDTLWAGSVDNISIKKITQYDPIITFKDFSETTQCEIRIGSNNLFFGFDSGLNIVSGISFNTSIGNTSLRNLTLGSGNFAGGYASGRSMTNASLNTMIGDSSFINAITVDKGVAAGNSAGSSWIDGENVICLGYNAQPSSAYVSNEATIGDSNITSFRCQVALTVLSDERDKANIENIKLGIDFLEDVSPIRYHLNDRRWYQDEINDGSKKHDEISFGFSAQNLLKACKKHGIKKSNLLKDDNDNKLEVTETKMIPINSQAIKDLNNTIKNQQNEIDELKELIQKLLIKDGVY